MALLEFPLRAIIPVLMISDQYPPFDILGSGFFVDRSGAFLTAYHVFRDNPLPPRSTYAVALKWGEDQKIFPAAVQRYSEELDIAIAKAEGVDSAEFLTIADDDPAMNQDMLTAEFSASKNQVNPEGDVYLNIIPSFQKGHVVWYGMSEGGTVIGAEILELSFPALKGASGAPVLHEKEGKVVGMLLSNYERHLLPAHIERIVGEAGEPIEERSYFLPHGIALSWRHLKAFLEEGAG